MPGDKGQRTTRLFPESEDHSYPAEVRTRDWTVISHAVAALMRNISAFFALLSVLLLVSYPALIWALYRWAF